jgi:hypothetical protein
VVEKIKNFILHADNKAEDNMTQEQEIRAKALEITIGLLGVMEEKGRFEQLKRGNPSKVVSDLSLDFENYLKAAK